MSTAALFTIAETWRQPKCPLTGMVKKDVIYICVCMYYTRAHTHTHTHTHTVEYYSTIKKDEIMISAATWMDLDTHHTK